MVKKKPLTFLHTYHHPATALLCYTQLVGHTSVSWVPITLNLTVHVVMYWYYFQAARGVKVWWKEWITRLQITQFVLDLGKQPATKANKITLYATCLTLLTGFVYFACWDYWSSTHAPWLPHVGKCAGDPVAAVMGSTILSSYLVLFVLFYINTYRKKASHKSKQPGEKKSVVASSMKESAAKMADSCTTSQQHTSPIISRK